jgi:hydrogenase maturation protease
LVLGLGNPLRGDDGIGPRVIEELNQRVLPRGVQTLDGGTGGLDLLNVLEGWERAIVVDAADMGQEPGQFVRFTADRARLVVSDKGFSFHNAGLAQVLALAQAIGQPMPKMIIFGIQPAELGWGEGLSPVVAAALPDLVDAIQDEIDTLLTGDA